MPSNHLIFCHPLLLLLSIFPSIRVFSNEFVLHIRWPTYWSFSFSISPSNDIQDWFPLGELVWSPCSLKDSQESSPTPEFKSINSSVLSFLYGPTLTSIHDYWWYEIGRGKSTCFPNTSLTRAMVTSPAPPVLRSLEFWLIPWPRGALSGEALHQL